MDFTALSNLPLRQLSPLLADADHRRTLFAGLTATRDAENPTLNAFEWRSEAAPTDVSSPLNGLPITVKDQFAVAGLPRTFGRDRPPRRADKASAGLIRQLLEMGATVSGKTTLPPNALDFQTFNQRRGITRNPHNPAFTTGGSSGGGAAAVASGMSLLDIGADLAGSLRIPAAWCGAVSLTPTEGALASGGMLPGTHTLAHFARPGPIARRIDDLRYFWECAGPGQTQPSDPLTTVCPVAPPAFLDAQSTQLWADQCKLWPQPQAPMDWLFDADIYRLFGEIMGHETGALLPWPIRWLARRDNAAAARSPGFLAHVHRGYARAPNRYADNMARLDALRTRARKSLPQGTALMLPVTGVCAFRHLTPTRDRGGARDYAQTFDLQGGPLGYLDTLTRFTVPLTLLGWPVVTLPVGQDANGLPFGVQLAGPPNGELALLKLAETVQTAQSTGLKVAV